MFSAALDVARVGGLSGRLGDGLPFLHGLDLQVLMRAGRVGAASITGGQICQPVEARRPLIGRSGVSVPGNFDYP